MTVIWPDGTAEEAPDEIDPMINQFCRFTLWYNSLPKDEQEKFKENLQQHGWSDKAQCVSDEAARDEGCAAVVTSSCELTGPRNFLLTGGVKNDLVST